MNIRIYKTYFYLKKALTYILLLFVSKRKEEVGATPVACRQIAMPTKRVRMDDEICNLVSVGSEPKVEITKSIAKAFEYIVDNLGLSHEGKLKIT